jgi:UDP-N-acetylmuramate--alanine ligase
MVAEADESDRSFLMLLPSIAVMTNIDHEHMDTYGSFDELQRAFVDFANKVPFYGSVVACVTIRTCARCVRRSRGGVVTYGLDETRASDPPAIVAVSAAGSIRRPVHVYRHTGRDATVLGTLDAVRARAPQPAECACRGGGGVRARRRLPRRGRHACASSTAPSAGSSAWARPTASWWWTNYGHHPTEIAAVLVCGRVTLGRRLLVAFQPHRYTRTERLMQEFGPAFADADEVVLTDIYAASEEPIAGVTVEALPNPSARATGRPVRIVKPIDTSGRGAGRRGTPRRRGADARRGIDCGGAEAAPSRAARRGRSAA